MTAAVAFPALGFDPAPGEPSAVDALASGCERALRELADAREAVLRTGQEGTGWDGRAAEGFRATAAELPGRIDTIGRSMESAGAALWLTVTVTALPGGAVVDVVPGMVEFLRTRHPAAEVREVPLPAGPAVRIEQRGSLDLPGGRVELVDVRHLLLVSGGEGVVTVAVQATDGDPALVAAVAGRIARGVRFGEGWP